MVATFGGDYRVMRVCFANANPLQAFDDLHHKISVRQFLSFIEYLDAKQTLDDEIKIKASRKADQEAQEAQRKANK